MLGHYVFGVALREFRLPFFASRLFHYYTHIHYAMAAETFPWLKSLNLIEKVSKGSAVRRACKKERVTRGRGKFDTYEKG
jgi:hypothetical protein